MIDQEMMESSRIFVKGLPPNIGTGEFRQHFSRQSAITDAKLIPRRRIGYVGYETPEAARNAVKYHNKSFIHMSRISVELAQSINRDNALQPRANAQSKVDKAAPDPQKDPHAGSQATLKRKRDETLEHDGNAKLQEYLQVMQRPTQSRTWASEDPASSYIQNRLAESPDRPMILTGQVENSHQESRKIESAVQDAELDQSPASDLGASSQESFLLQRNSESVKHISVKQDRTEQAASDNDWVRSRTSRLLGLVDNDDVAAPQSNSVVDDPQEKVDTEPGEASRSRRPSKISAQFSQGSEDPPKILNETTDTGRLFMRNMPYSATENDIWQYFESQGYGPIEEVHIPIDHGSGKNKGFAYIQFIKAEAAVQALQDLDGKPFQGRLLHIIPSAAKKPTGLDEVALSKLPLKKQQRIKRRTEAESSIFNWNSMYMNVDAVVSSISDRLGIQKSDLMDPTSADTAVKQAYAETHIIQETKAYFTSNGVNLDTFKQGRRGGTAILVKNFSYGTTVDDLKVLFEVYGVIKRLLMPPSGTIAIIQFEQADQARSAFRGLAYRKFKGSILFLEKAPLDLFMSEDEKGSTIIGIAKGQVVNQSAADLLGREDSHSTFNTSTLFVRNLNFSTSSERLKEVFRSLDGFLSARVKTKPDPKNIGQTLSMGFGFLEFTTKQQAQAAQEAMDGHKLDGHELLIRASHNTLDAAEERRKEDNAKKTAGRRTKIIVKNLPFEATKKDVRSLFGAFGQLRSVRMPKKFDSSTRGFAFADFVSAREAENAIDALRQTHLLGRRLVLDFAAEEEIDPEKEIEKMQKKVGYQADKVALQRLTGSTRKKFVVEPNEEFDRG